MDITVTHISIVRLDSRQDRVYLTTTLPNVYAVEVDDTPTLSIQFDSPQSKTLVYLAVNFPGVPVEMIDARQSKGEREWLA